MASLYYKIYKMCVCVCVCVCVFTACLCVGSGAHIVKGLLIGTLRCEIVKCTTCEICSQLRMSGCVHTTKHTTLIPIIQ